MSQNSRQPTNARWYAEPKDGADATLCAVFRTVRDECSWRLDADEYHLGFYRSSEKAGVKGHSRLNYDYAPATLPYNVCRGAVDSLQSKIAKHRPLPQVLTQRGSYSNQKRARKMTQFLEGEFYAQRIFEQKAKLLIRDALIFGRGILKIWTEGKRIKSERCHPWELYTDEWDARYGSPRNMYHCRSVDKGVLLEQFARTESGGWKQSVKQAIEDAGRFALSDDWADTGGSTVDRIDIVEAYHLCDRPEEHEPPEPETVDDDEEKDDGDASKRKAQGDQPRKHRCTGRHVVATTSGTLIDEPWEHDYFPYAVLNYSDPSVGYWGAGLVEQLEGYQYEINLSSERLSEMFHLSGVHIMVPDNAKIHDQQIRNGMSITRHAPGGKPEVFQMDLVNEHVRARPRELTEDALNDAGLSQMSVQSQKPAGINSGIGLQTLDDIETERFMVFGRAYEAWCLELARRFIDCAKEVAEAYGDHAVSVPMKTGLLRLNWKDVSLDGIELRVFATSLLPQQIGARLEKLLMLWEMQVIDRATFLRHLDAPDMQAELDLETADKLVIDEMLEKMLEAEEDEGEAAYLAPSAYQDFTWAARRAQQKYNRALLDGAPEFNLDMLQRYMKQCQSELDRMAGAAANMNGAPAPGANPAPPMPAVPTTPNPGPAMAPIPAPMGGAPPMAA